MTPKHPIYEAVDGKRYEVVDYRCPMVDEWFLAALPDEYGPVKANSADERYCANQETYRHILKELPSPEPSEGGIQRRENWMLSPYFVTKGRTQSADDLIDAACAVVNDIGAKNGHVLIATLENLAAKLAPFTEPTPQPERYFASGMWVRDRKNSSDSVASCASPQHAEEIAAALNTQEVDQ